MFSLGKLLARSDISDEHLCTALAKLETTKNAGGRSSLLLHHLDLPYPTSWRRNWL